VLRNKKKKKKTTMAKNNKKTYIAVLCEMTIFSDNLNFLKTFASKTSPKENPISFFGGGHLECQTLTLSIGKEVGSTSCSQGRN
jgi:predicted transcriptional regulator YheO